MVTTHVCKQALHACWSHRVGKDIGRQRVALLCESHVKNGQPRAQAAGQVTVRRALKHATHHVRCVRIGQQHTTVHRHAQRGAHGELEHEDVPAAGTAGDCYLQRRDSGMGGWVIHFLTVDGNLEVFHAIRMLSHQHRFTKIPAM